METLTGYLERTVRYELKWMYHYEVDDCEFGVETDKYMWCRRVLDGRASVDGLLEYFEMYYTDDERGFIEKVKELAK